MRRKTAGVPATLAYAAALLCLGMASHAQAASHEPIELSADQAEMNSVTGTGIYTGNVVLTRGNMKITGDRMTVSVDGTQTVTRIIVEGTPATFRRRAEGSSPVHAEAPRLEYVGGPPEQIRLHNGAYLRQGKNEFSGATIIYDIAESRVLARGEGEQRPRIRFFPREPEGGATQ